MLSFERYHTMLKKLTRGNNNVWSSLAHHFAMLWSSNLWRCPSQGDNLLLYPFRSTITGKDKASDRVLIVPQGKQRPGVLGTGSNQDFHHVQELWGCGDPDYGALRDRFFADERTAQRPEDRLPIQDYWAPNGEPLTVKQTAYLAMVPRAFFMKGAYVTLNGNTVLFRTKASQDSRDPPNKNCNYCVKTSFHGIGDVFGWILRMFNHTMHVGGPTRVIVECEWFTSAGTKWLPQVKHDPDSYLNRDCRFVFLEVCSLQHTDLVTQP